METKFFRILSLTTLIILASLLYCQNANNRPCTSINGTIGSSPQFFSGWIDLNPSEQFLKGDIVEFQLGGTAKFVKVRFLKDKKLADQPIGLLDSTFRVPQNRVLVIKLKSDQRNIQQISVHGGPNPWRQFPLGENNGPATIISVCRR